MTKIIVTGINGFVGKHLTRELVDHGIEVIGVGMDPEIDSELGDSVSSYYQADLSRTWPVMYEVDAVIHLAGLAAVGPSFDDPQKYINLNSAMLTHMGEYYLLQEKSPRLIIVSSGTVYNPKQTMPLTEESGIGLSSPYAVSKILVENQCQYYRNRGLDCIIVRPFNHIGPGQSSGFLVPDIVSQLTTSNTVTVGNIATKRDYTDVRDIARAYRLLATTPKLKNHTYNACSGVSIAGEQILDLLKLLLDKPSANVVVDQDKVRPTDPADICGDYSRLKNDTDWSPTYTLKQTLTDIIND